MFNMIETYESTVNELVSNYNDRYAKACEAYKRGDVGNYNKNVIEMNKIKELLDQLNNIVMTTMA